MEKNIKMKRSFSTEFKKEKVKLIEEGKLRIREVVTTYQVSQTSVYKWLIKYGVNYSKTERVVVEKISEENKTIELLKKVAELERIIGQQQLKLIYKEALISSISEELGEDIEKKYNTQQLKKD